MDDSQDEHEINEEEAMFIQLDQTLPLQTLYAPRNEQQENTTIDNTDPSEAGKKKAKTRRPFSTIDKNELNLTTGKTTTNPNTTEIVQNKVDKPKRETGVTAEGTEDAQLS